VTIPTAAEIDAAIADLERRPRRPLTITTAGSGVRIELDERDAQRVRQAMLTALRRLRCRTLLRERRIGSRSSTAA